MLEAEFCLHLCAFPALASTDSVPMCWMLSLPFYLLAIMYGSLFVHHKNFGLKNIDNLYGSYCRTSLCGVTMDILYSLEVIFHTCQGPRYWANYTVS